MKRDQTVFLDFRAFEHARIEAGISKKEVARRMGWHPNSLVNVLRRARGNEAVKKSTLLLIAFALGVQPETLVVEDSGKIFR